MAAIGANIETLSNGSKEPESTINPIQSRNPIMKELQGKVCFITGGSRGIGRAIALAMADAGADVAFTYLRNQEKAEEVVQTVREKGVRCKAYRDDAACSEETEQVVKQVTEEFGPISILVNNAGITRDKSFL